jgi:hypothetical protein
MESEATNSSSLPVASASASAPVHRVVVALCYRSPGNFLTIPNCPYCFCTHKHRVPGITLTRIKHVNGAVIPYRRSMFTKISDCETASYTYALELRRETEIPIELKKLCRGVTAKNRPCQRKVRAGACVCLTHEKQLEAITTKRANELLVKLNA